MKRVLALAALIPLTACSGAGTAVDSPSSLAPVPPAPATDSTPSAAESSAIESEEPDATPTASAAETPQAAATNARGNLVKGLGEEAGVVDFESGELIVSFKVTGIEPNFTCTSEYAEESANGNFIAISLDVTTSAAFGADNYFSVSEYAWKVISPEGTTENDSTGNGYMCLNSSEQIPSDFGPGEHAVGKVVLDSQHAAGALVLEQPTMAGGWEWSYGG